MPTTKKILEVSGRSFKSQQDIEDTELQNISKDLFKQHSNESGEMTITGFHFAINDLFLYHHKLIKTIVDRRDYKIEFECNNDTKIRKWMRENAKDFIDECGELNCTGLVEAWDNECSTGEATLDESHIAWDIAIEEMKNHE